MLDIGEERFLTSAEAGSGAPGGPPTGWTDLFGATLASMQEVDNSNSRSLAMERAANDIIDGLERAGIKDHGLRNPVLVMGAMGPRPLGGPDLQREDPISAFERRRIELADKHPEQRDLLKLDRSLAELARQRARAAEENATDIAQRYRGTLPTWTASLSGGIVGSFYDPVNVLSLAAGPWARVGLGARQLLWQGIKTGAVNAGTELAIQPIVQAWRREAGLEYGLEPAAFNVAAAFGFGAALDLGIRGGWRGIAPRAGFVPRLDENAKVEGWMRPRPAAETWADARGRTFEPMLDQQGNVEAYRPRAPSRPAPGARPDAQPADGTGARLPGDQPDIPAATARTGEAGATQRARLPEQEAEDAQARPAEPGAAAPSIPSDGRPRLPGAAADARPSPDIPAGQTTPRRIPGSEALEQVARNRPPEDLVRRARDGDLRAADELIQGTDLADRPDIKGARQTAETQDKIGDEKLVFTDESDHAEAVLQAIKAGIDPDYELPPRGLDPAMPVRAGHGDLGDQPSARTDYFVDGKLVQARLLKTADIGFDDGAFPPNRAREDTLASVRSWDPFAADHGFYVYEQTDGTLVVAEGHNRLRLAHRLEAQGRAPDEGLDIWAEVFREAEGWAESDVRARASKKNVQEGRIKDPVELAVILRERPDIMDASIPRNPYYLRQAMALARLSDDAWARVLAGDIDPNHAMHVGRLVEDKAQHGPIMDVLVKANPTNEQQVRGIISDLVQGPSAWANEILLGGDPGRALIAERSSVLDQATKLLKDDARIFALLVKESPRIESLGNVLRLDPNADRVLQSETVRAIIESLAARPGPVRDWLTEAAREAADASGRSARARRTAAKAAGNRFAERIRRALEEDGFRALKPYEPAPLSGTGGIDVPGGPEARAQIERLEAELQTAVARRQRQVAERWLGRFEDERAASGGRMAPIPPDVRQEAIRLILEGEDAASAVATARRNLAEQAREKAAKSDERARAEAARAAETAPADLDRALDQMDQYGRLIAGAGLTPEELARFRAMGGQFTTGEVAPRPLPTPGQLLPVEARDIPQLIDTWRELQELRALPEEQRSERRFRIMQLEDDLSAVGVPRSAATEEAVREALQARVEGRVPEDRAALLGSPDQHPEAIARREFAESVGSGSATDVPFPVVLDVLGVLRPHVEALGGLPEGWRVGVLEHVKPVSGTNRVSAMFRGLDGKAFVVEHLTLDHIRGSRALFRPSRKSLLFFRFTAPDVVPVAVEADAVAIIGAAEKDVLGRNALLRRQFEQSLTGEFVHELLHLRRYLGLLDETRFGLLVSHGKDLRLLDSDVNTYMRAIGRSDGATSQPGRTLLARYEADYSTKPDPADAVDEEYATHLAELAWHGQLLPQELAPVRTALEEIFGEPMARRLAALDTNPGLAPVAPSVGTATPGLMDLRAAQTMEAMGRTPVEIQAATGWFRDGEGSWHLDPRHSRQAGPAVASFESPAALAPEAEAAMLLEQLAVIEDLRLAGTNIESDGERILGRLEELAAKARDTEYSRTPSPQVLDMSPEARKARAEAMGFDTSRVWYHGTGADFDAFSHEFGGENTGRGPATRAAFFFASDPTHAEAAAQLYDQRARNRAEAEADEVEANRGVLQRMFGRTPQPPDYIPTGRVMSVYLRKGRQATIDLKGKEGAGGPTASEIVRLQREGYDSVLLLNTIEGEHEIAVFDPSNIRSVNAAFDPSDSASSRLMAAIGGDLPERISPALFAWAQHLSWTGLPQAPFMANLEHFARKRGGKNPMRFGPDGRLDTPERVEAHIKEVLASPTLTWVKANQEGSFSLNLVRLGERFNRLVAVRLTGAVEPGQAIATVYNQSHAETASGLAAALHQEGVARVRYAKTPDAERGVLRLMEQVRASRRGSSWAEFMEMLAPGQGRGAAPRTDVGEAAAPEAPIAGIAPEDRGPEIEAWAQMARRAQRFESGTGGVREGADTNTRMFQAISALERKLLDEGRTLGEVAAALEGQFGMPFDPGHIAQREAWWRMPEIVRRGRWMPKHDAELARVHAEGMPIRDIANHMTEVRGMETTVSAVQQRLHQKRLATVSRRPRTLAWLNEEREAMLESLIGQRKTDAEIAGHFAADPALSHVRITATTIATARGWFGLAGGGRGRKGLASMSPEVHATIRELWAVGGAEPGQGGGRERLAREIARELKARHGVDVGWSAVYNFALGRSPRPRAEALRPLRAKRANPDSPWIDPDVMAMLTSEDIADLSASEAAALLNERFGARGYAFTRRSVIGKRFRMEGTPVGRAADDDRSAILGTWFADETVDPFTDAADNAARVASIVELLKACRS